MQKNETKFLKIALSLLDPFCLINANVQNLNILNVFFGFVSLTVFERALSLPLFLTKIGGVSAQLFFSSVIFVQFILFFQ